MTIYDKDQIDELYESNLTVAKQKLSEIKVFCGTEPSFSGLNGWVFEQTIQYCLRKELEARKVRAEIKEQVKLKSRVKVDIGIGKVVIEIKQSGLFNSPDIDKYKRYRKFACDKGLEYLFVSGGESYQPYKDGVIKAIGQENAFFLDKDGEWERFISRLVRLVK